MLMSHYLLRTSARLLRLPARAMATALTYLHHFALTKHLIDAQEAPSDQMAVAACIFLATKVEEVAVSNNHLLNVVLMLHHLLSSGQLTPHTLHSYRAQQPEAVPDQTEPQAPPVAQQATTAAASADMAAHSVAADARMDVELDGAGTVTGTLQLAAPVQTVGGASIEAPAQGDAPEADRAHANGGRQQGTEDAECRRLEQLIASSEVLVGQAYYDAKAQLLQAEQQLLRLLQFQLRVAHPAAALMHVLASLDAPKAVAEAAVALLNDVATFTDLLAPAGMTAGSLSTGPSTDLGAPRDAAEPPAAARPGGGRAADGAAGAHAPATHGGFKAGSISGEEREAEAAVACALLASELLGVALPQGRAGAHSLPKGRGGWSSIHWADQERGAELPQPDPHAEQAAYRKGRGQETGKRQIKEQGRRQVQEGGDGDDDRWQPQSYEPPALDGEARGRLHTAAGRRSYEASAQTQKGMAGRSSRDGSWGEQPPAWIGAFGVQPARVVRLAAHIFEALVSATQGLNSMQGTAAGVGEHRAAGGEVAEVLATVPLVTQDEGTAV